MDSDEPSIERDTLTASEELNEIEAANSQVVSAPLFFEGKKKLREEGTERGDLNRQRFTHITM